MKKIRKIIFILFKLCILSLLINSMLLFISESKVPLSDFINQGFKSVYFYKNCNFIGNIFSYGYEFDLSCFLFIEWNERNC